MCGALQARTRNEKSFLLSYFSKSPEQIGKKLASFNIAVSESVLLHWIIAVHAAELKRRGQTQ